MKSICICLAALCLVSAGLAVNIYESLDITRDQAKKSLVASIGSGFVSSPGNSSLVSNAKKLSIETKVEGIHQLMQMAREYTGTDDFRKEYKKWRNEQLHPKQKGKLGIPKLGKMLDQAVDDALDKKDNDKNYPEDADALVKTRLQDFIRISATVDFDAELEGNMFVKKEYENKSSWWKMCFRAGREVVQAAREDAQKWLDELNKNQQK